MENVRVLVVDRNDLENPYGDYSGNLTSHLIKHPDLIAERAQFIQAELGIATWEQLQRNSSSLYVDLVFEDESSIYLVEVKDNSTEVEKGKKQVLEYVDVFKRDLEWRRLPLSKTVVPIVATLAKQ